MQWQGITRCRVAVLCPKIARHTYNLLRDPMQAHYPTHPRRTVCLACRMQDQLIVFMTLARGESRMLCRTPTLHTHTAIAVAQQLTGAQFDVKERGQDLSLIVCGGAAVCAGASVC